MDNKIYIDGVDVSECDYVLNNSLKGKQHCPNKAMPYAKETSCIECKTNSTRYNFCKHNPNCYYKQLQRLKEDKKYRLEEIQNLNNKIKILTSITDKTNKYKQALEEVREITKKYYLSDKNLLATGIGINPYGAIIGIRDKINEVLK